MNRFSVLIISIFLLFTGCVGLQFTGTAPPNQAFAYRTSLPSVGESATAIPSETNNSLVAIPMHVGYGVSNSWVELYFTDPINPASRQITGGVDAPLVAAIDSEHLSVDAAIYSLSWLWCTNRFFEDAIPKLG